MLAAKI